MTVSGLFYKKKETAFWNLAITWFGLFYIVWTLSHILLIRDLRPEGKLYTFFLFFVIWALDVGAYWGGKKLGHHRLMNTVSPKKTWEGVITGSLSALFTAWICHLIFLKTLPVIQVFVLAGVILIVAQLSDLSESLLKRNVEVKDSSHLLPGHGGMLDRFDSFLLSAPAYYYALVIWVHR
jgi:phosphatidate cytidylyltransferase